jgi:hypothetical protein
MTDEGKAVRRPRRQSAATQELEQLLSRRAELDKDKVEKEQREKDALRQYADAAVQLKTIDAAAHLRVEELEKQVAEVRRKAQGDKAGVESEQARALAALSELGRTADELATLFDLPVKRVRRMVQAGKKDNPARATVTAPTWKASGDVAPSTDENATSAVATSSGLAESRGEVPVAEAAPTSV